jgi:hypothetical protein
MFMTGGLTREACLIDHAGAGEGKGWQGKSNCTYLSLLRAHFRFIFICTSCLLTGLSRIVSPATNK